MRDELRHQLQKVPSKWAGGLRKFLTADAIAASNSIEGFRVSTIDVEDLIVGERDVEGVAARIGGPALHVRTAARPPESVRGWPRYANPC